MPEEPPIQQRGTSRSYILTRLKNEGLSDLAAAVEAGTISAFAAAVECGWARRPPTMRAVTNQAQRRRHQFQTIAGDNRLAAYQELWLGPGHDGSVFDSPEELRAAWEQHQDEVMRLFANSGRRPMAWWAFVAPGLGLQWPGYRCQQSYLYVHGALSEQEHTQLLADWRQEFEQAQAPGFSLSDGEQILRGDRARAAHYAWADIPAELVEQWEDGRRRGRGRTAPKTSAAILGDAATGSIE